MRSRPPYESEARVRLAELRRKQGRFEEATTLFQDVEWHPMAALGLAELALERGHLRDAREYVERILRQVPERNIAQRADALELLVRVQAASGEHDAARDTLTTLNTISDKVASPLLRAAVGSLNGVLQAASGDHERARASFEDAAAAFERAGTPYEAARARLELALVLQALGRTQRAAQEAGVALKAFRSLGAASEAARAERMAAGPPASTPVDLLTERQLEVLRLVAQGLSDREIAAVLVMSEHTVHRHVANILLRLGLPSRAAAVAHASRLGLL
jgi:LuxR family maltose regulon positive regulatory protein